MEGDWIKLHRKLLEWEWWSDDVVSRLWVHILLSSNYEDKKWRGIVVPRGSFVTSVKHLSESLKLSSKQIRRGLECLKNCENVTIKTTNKFTLISVCNYDSYQAKENPEGQAEGQTKGKQRANKGQQHKNIRREEYNNTSINESIYINTLTSSNECMGGAGGMPTEVGQAIQTQPEVNSYFAGFLGWCRENAPAVLEMKQPMTEKQFLTLRERFGSKALAEIIAEMGNYAKLKSNNVSAYLTANNWLMRREKERMKEPANGLPAQPPSRYAAAAAQAERMKQYLEPNQPKEETIEEYERRQLERLSGV